MTMATDDGFTNLCGCDPADEEWECLELRPDGDTIAIRVARQGDVVLDVKMREFQDFVKAVKAGKADAYLV